MTTTIQKDSETAITLSTVFSIKATKTSGIEPFAYPASDSHETDGMDFEGVVRTLTVSGMYVGADFATVLTWIDSIEGLIDGNQRNMRFIDTDRFPATYNNSNNMRVMIKSFDTTVTKAKVVACNWTLQLTEVSTTSI